MEACKWRLDTSDYQEVTSEAFEAFLSNWNYFRDGWGDGILYRDHHYPGKVIGIQLNDGRTFILKEP